MRKKTQYARRLLRLDAAKTETAIFVSMSLVWIVLAAYLLRFSIVDFNSDSESLLALTMRDHGSMLPKTWIVGNGDFYLPSTGLLVYFLTHWLDNGFLANALATTALSAAYLASVAYFLRRVDMPRPAAAFVLLLLAAGYSQIFTLVTYVEGAYLWWPMGFFLLAGLVATNRHGLQIERRNGVLLALFLVSWLIAMKNPQRVAVMMILPFLVFDRALCHFSAAPRGSAVNTMHGMSPRIRSSELAVLAGLLLAWLQVRLLLHFGVITSYNLVSQIQLTNISGFVNHALLFLNGWFQYIGAYAENNAAQAVEPFFRTFRTTLAVVLTFVLVLELRDFRDQNNPYRRAVLCTFFATLISVLVLYLAFDPLAQTFRSTRYFTLAYLLATILAGWRVQDWLQHGRFMRACIALFCVMVFLGCAERLLPLDAAARARRSPQQVLAQTLRDEHLDYGYATWWNAGATTTLADSLVRVYPIELSADGVRPSATWVDTTWYRPENHIGPTFLVLDDSDMTPENTALLARRLGEPTRSIGVPDAAAHILVYDRNIAQSFDCSLSESPLNTALDDSSIANITITSADVVAQTATSAMAARLTLNNASTSTISSVGDYPISVGFSLYAADGHLLNHDLLHAALACPLGAGQSREMSIALPHLDPGTYRIDIDLVQERVRWFGWRGAEPVHRTVVVTQ